MNTVESHADARSVRSEVTMQGSQTSVTVPLVIPGFFEDKFKHLISDIGSYKIKMKQSYLLLPYLMIKMQCETERFKYETIIVGDECENERSARENAFRKAFYLLQRKYKPDIAAGGKEQRNRTNSVQSDA